jgi:hypothetical protein
MKRLKTEVNRQYKRNYISSGTPQSSVLLKPPQIASYKDPLNPWEMKRLARSVLKGDYNLDEEEDRLNSLLLSQMTQNQKVNMLSQMKTIKRRVNSTQPEKPPSIAWGSQKTNPFRKTSNSFNDGSSEDSYTLDSYRRDSIREEAMVRDPRATLAVLNQRFLGPSRKKALKRKSAIIF